MKIQNKLKHDLNTVLSTQGNQKIKSTTVKKTFLEELKQVHGEETKARLDQLLDLIDQQGEKLAKHRTFKEFVKYKKMVSSFVEEVVDKMYQVKEDYSPIQGKVYNLVNKVDQSLEELTEMIVDDQSAQLEILDKLDEMRGLLVDLYR
ncbi:YaaR family protein [Natroniella sulfidigena]|uniref:YaaR family protein n=1 Tax=Natroniella sulfidigena TaxID=723921 RepID=UPI00200B0D2D|nr:YaaR family protein [Natroniella sulfidigena]MCK8817092.1 YaaR family protein [Natroniella sulfidigena]